MILVLNTRTRDPQVNLPKAHKFKTKDTDTKEHALKLCTSGIHEHLCVDGVGTSNSMSTVERSAFLAKLILPVHGVDQRHHNHSWIYHLPSFTLSSNHWLWFHLFSILILFCTMAVSAHEAYFRVLFWYTLVNEWAKCVNKTRQKMEKAQYWEYSFKDSYLIAEWFG